MKCPECKKANLQPIGAMGTPTVTIDTRSIKAHVTVTYGCPNCLAMMGMDLPPQELAVPGAIKRAMRKIEQFSIEAMEQHMNAIENDHLGRSDLDEDELPF